MPDFISQVVGGSTALSDLKLETKVTLSVIMHYKRSVDKVKVKRLLRKDFNLTLRKTSSITYINNIKHPNREISDKNYIDIFFNMFYQFLKIIIQ